MIHSLRLALFASLLAIPSFASAQDKPLTRIAFGSCAHQEKPLPIWKSVVGVKPELMLMLGDNIYADTDDMKVMKDKYDKAAAHPDYQTLRKSCPTLGIWDDHDYGKNDAGVEYAKKEESQQLFLDFFDVPKDSPLRKQKGIYQSQTYGPAGKRVQVIMLDGRYFRSPMKRGKREPGMTYTPYIANTEPGATILGEEQWKWLEEQLKKPAEIRLLVSGIQIVAEDHGFEKWMNFPNERERLYKLLRDTKAAGVIALSGDRHLAELCMMERAVDYPLYDLTASGFNQADKKWRPLEKNRHRVATMGHGDNFGVVTIDWNATDPVIGLQIRDVDGDITIQQKLHLSDLQVGAHVAKKGVVEVEQPKPKDGAITALEATKKVGEKVTVEMRVSSTGGTVEKRLYLNSKKSFTDAENFAVVVMPKAFTGKLEKATRTTFADKIIRVTGTVTTFKTAPQIVVDDEKQIEIVSDK
ncbi:MAG: alkaline phosphatase family protein [Planctomycetes bacterium]|nr:alkaline phosphatase family protein [Planctomycetota bacterium]